MAEIYKEKPTVKVVMLKGQDGKDGEDKLINQADGSGLRFWVGTQAEYDAIPAAELISNCVYYITDNTADDLRTDINSIDNRVTQNYSDLSGQISNTSATLMQRIEAVLGNMTELETRLNAEIAALEDGATYAQGDIGQIYYNTAGYVTTNSSMILFTIPLPKIVPSDCTLTGTVKVRLRQSGRYVAFSSASTFAEFTTGWDASINITNGKHARITLTNMYPVDGAFDNAVNNDAIGVECQFDYTVSAR